MERVGPKKPALISLNGNPPPHTLYVTPVNWSTENRRKGRRAAKDFDSLLEHSPVHNSHNILHSKAPSSSAAAAAAAARGQRHLSHQDPAFWSPEASLSPDRPERRQAGARASASSSSVRASSGGHQARDGGGQRHHQPQSHHSGPTSYGPRGSGRLSSSAGERDAVSPGRHMSMRHSYDGFNHLAAGVRRQQQQQQQHHGAAASTGNRNGGNGLGASAGAARVSSAVGDGGVVGAHDLEALLEYRMAALRDSARRQQRSSATTPMDPMRRSGPLSGGSRGAGNGGTGVVKGDASVEYAAVRREIELEREAMSRRTQEQLRELEGGDGGGLKEEEEGREHDHDEEEDERYTSFGSGSNEDQDDQDGPPRRHHRSEDTASAENDDEMGEGVPLTPLSRPTGRDYLQGGAGEDGREESVHLAESLALELQESVVPLAAAAAGRRFKGTAAARLPKDQDQAAAPAAETPHDRSTRMWLEREDSNSSIPDDVVAASSSVPSEAEAVPESPEMGGDSGSEGVGGGDFGTGRQHQLRQVEEEVEENFSEVQEEVASFGGSEEVVEEVLDDVDYSVAGRNERDRDDEDDDVGDYGSVSFEADDNEAPDEHEAAAASEVESNTSDAAPGASAAAAAQYSQDFEASSPAASGGAASVTAVSASLPLTPGDGTSEGLRSPPALYQSLDGDVARGSGGVRRSGSASGLRQPGSSGSLASMEAAVARRRDKVQQMRRKLEGLQESRGRVRAKRLLAQQLEALEVGMNALLPNFRVASRHSIFFVMALLV